MIKKALLLAVVSGILAGVASIIFQKVYNSSLGADFTKIVKPSGLVLVCVIGNILAGLGYWVLTKLLKSKGEIVFNFIYVLLSFASIMGAFAFKLPFDAATPELFPGLVVPMHFFPALAWFTLKPIFIRNQIA